MFWVTGVLLVALAFGFTYWTVWNPTYPRITAPAMGLTWLVAAFGFLNLQSDFGGTATAYTESAFSGLCLLFAAFGIVFWIAALVNQWPVEQQSQSPREQNRPFGAAETGGSQ